MVNELICGERYGIEVDETASRFWVIHSKNGQLWARWGESYSYPMAAAEWASHHVATRFTNPLQVVLPLLRLENPAGHGELHRRVVLPEI
jgi:hypothetical protein